MNPSLARPRFYFALPRLLHAANGGNPVRTESNHLEACIAGAAFYLVTCAFVFEQFGRIDNLWARIGVAGASCFVVFFFWVLLVYVNALLIRVGRNLFRKFPPDRVAQHAMLSMLTTLFAVALARGEGGFRLIGWGWLVAVALNLTAALLLKMFSLPGDDRT